MSAYGKHARHVYWTNHSRLDRDNDGTAFEAWVVRRGQRDAEDPRKTAEDTRHRLATPSRDRKERYPRHGSISRQAPGVRIGSGAAIRDLQASRTLSPPATTAPRELTRQISHRWSPSMRRGQSWHASSPPRNASPIAERRTPVCECVRRSGCAIAGSSRPRQATGLPGLGTVATPSFEPRHCTQVHRFAGLDSLLPLGSFRA
jgi:hypothetical protein